MTIDVIPKSLYPLVPSLPGVPAVLRSYARVFDTATLGYLGIGDALNSAIGSEPVQWGVFDTAGKSIADYDSFNSFRYRNESAVSTYPLEQGGFATYNKVDSPYDAVVTLACGGSGARRAAFQVAIETARRTLQLYTILTPEVTYISASIVAIDVQRQERNGSHIIIANLHVQEVRQKTTAAYSSTKSNGLMDSPQPPGATPVRPQGQIQGLSPTPEQIRALPALPDGFRQDQNTQLVFNRAGKVDEVLSKGVLS